MQFTIRRLMLAVSAVALILAPARFARHAVPHFRRCRVLYLEAEYESRTCRSLAALYRDCGRDKQSIPSIHYCQNPCMDHLRPASAEQEGAATVDATQLAAAARRRDRIAEEHRLAAEDHERIAEIFIARARRCWRAAFRPWEAPPAWTEAEKNADELFTRYTACNKF